MPQAETDQAEQKLRQWIEAALGRVVEFGPLPGWRPAWNASVETPAGIIGVHIRGDRDAGQEMQPSRREYDVLCLLESEGIPVPKMYGWFDDTDRKRVVEGKSVSVRVELGCRRISKQKKNSTN